MYLLYDKDYIIRVISSKKASSENLFSVKVKNDRAWSKLIYKKPRNQTTNFALQLYVIGKISAVYQHIANIS